MSSDAPRVLIVAERGARLRVHHRSIVVESREGRYTVPVSEVDRIVLVTSQVSITTSAIRRLAKLGIDILVLGARGEPVTTITPPWFTATSETRVAQYRAATSPAERLAIAKSIVRAKMLSQAGFLETLAIRGGPRLLSGEAERIREYAAKTLTADSIEKLRVLEAHAARRYWGALRVVVPSDLGFEGRNPDAGDDLNTILNYLYALLYAWVKRYLVMYGLDPYLGFIHADRSGKPSLAFDAAELFRVSAVDRLAYHLVAVRGWRPTRDPDTNLLTPEARQTLIQEYASWLRRTVTDASTGKKATLERHMALQARLLAQAVRRRSPYTPFTEAPTP